MKNQVNNCINFENGYNYETVSQKFTIFTFIWNNRVCMPFNFVHLLHVLGIVPFIAD